MGPITLRKFLCRNIAPERMIEARLNPNFFKKKFYAAFKGVERLFRVRSHFENFFVDS